MNATLLLGVALAVAAPAPKETPKETPKLEGTWLIEKSADEKKPTAGMTFTFKDGTLTINQLGKVGEQPEIGSYSIDLTKNPFTIDLQPFKGLGTLIGIFEIRDDTLRMCLGAKDERPTEFKSELDKGTKLVVLKRVQPEKK